MGLQTGATLGLRDVFYLGRFAYMQNKPYVALHWLKEAIAQAPFDDSKILDQNQVNAIHVTHLTKPNVLLESGAQTNSISYYFRFKWLLMEFRKM